MDEMLMFSFALGTLIVILPIIPAALVYLCLYVMEQGQPVYCTVPSLVEHAAPGHSTLGNSNSGRVARWFIGLQDSPLDVDWTKGLPKPPYDSGNVSTNWMRK